VPTIADVAARAGVGVGTVSRVLNATAGVSPRTRGLVHAAISDLGYRPSARARALSLGRSFTVGVVVPFFTHPSAVARLRGVLAALDATRYDVVLFNVASPVQRDEHVHALALGDRTDGLLMISLSPRDEQVELLRRSGVPAVLVDAEHPDLPRVVGDDVEGGRMAARHLLDLGHERLAFVGDAPDPAFGFVSSRRRCRGWLEALSLAGIDPAPAYLKEGPHEREAARRLGRELLALDEPPTAVFAASDNQALGVLEAAADAGVRVPDELSVVGFDDLDQAAWAGLTTVRQQLEESGRRGAELLLAGLEGLPLAAEEELLPLELRVRATTAPPRA
jgi:LacI family transcriptional regulator